MPLNPFIKGGSDVPVTDGGTGASSAATARVNLGNVLDETAHDLLDHAGLTGVGDLTTLAHASIDHSVVPATFFNVGSATAAVANGDFAAGDGTRELFFDASTGTISITGINAGGEYLNILGVANGDVGVHIDNNSSGALATARILIETADSQGQFTAFSGTHATWPDTILLGASSNAAGGLALSTGQGPMTFYTQSIKRWEIQGAGHLLASGADNTYDFGASGASRARIGYFGTSLNVGSGITPSAANGDFVVGDGTREMRWDASAAILDFATTTTIRANGAGLDLTLGARGATYNLNDAGNTVLNTSNQTIIGALNELVAATPVTGQVEQTYGNDTGFAISANRLVAPDASGGGANDVAEASATNDGPSSSLIGVTETSIPDTGTGQVISYGRVPIAWVGGEAKPSNSAPVYLSTTAGLATSVPPAAAGNIILLIGYVTDNTGLSATTISGETALVSFFIDGPRLVV